MCPSARMVKFWKKDIIERIKRKKNDEINQLICAHIICIQITAGRWLNKSDSSWCKNCKGLEPTITYSFQKMYTTTLWQQTIRRSFDDVAAVCFATLRMLWVLFVFVLSVFSFVWLIWHVFAPVCAFLRLFTWIVVLLNVDLIESFRWRSTQNVYSTV